MVEPRKLKLLYISDLSSVHTSRWIRYMADKGHKVTILSTRSGKLDGVKVIYRDCGDLPGPRWLKRIRHLWFVLNEWLLIKLARYDIVHIHFLRADLSGLVATRHPCCIISVWGSDVRPVSEGGDPRRQAVKRLALERSAKITVTNPFLEDKVRQLAPKSKNIEVIPFGVDLTTFNPTRWTPVSPDIIRFCFVKSKLIPLYGPDIVIKAMELVVKNFPGAYLAMLGAAEEDYFSELNRLIKHCRLEKHIQFIGRIDNKKMISIYEKCDVLIQCSRWESFGVVILEAAAVGVPAIATRVGGTNDLVLHGITGLTVLSDDHAALASAMLKLAKDVELRSRLGQNARVLATELYNFDMHAERMEEIYYEMCSEGS